MEVVDRGDLAHAAFFVAGHSGSLCVVRRDDKTVSVPIKKAEKRAVLLREEESKIGEVDGAMPVEIPCGQQVPLL